MSCKLRLVQFEITYPLCPPHLLSRPFFNMLLTFGLCATTTTAATIAVAALNLTVTRLSFAFPSRGALSNLACTTLLFMAFNAKLPIHHTSRRAFVRAPVPRVAFVRPIVNVKPRKSHLSTTAELITFMPFLFSFFSLNMLSCFVFKSARLMCCCCRRCMCVCL